MKSQPLDPNDQLIEEMIDEDTPDEWDEDLSLMLLVVMQ